MAGDEAYPENKTPPPRFTPPCRVGCAVSRSYRPVPTAEQIAIFVPGQGDDDEIDGGEQQQRYRMRKHVAVHLIDDEKREQNQRHRVIPETLAHQPDYDPQFYGTVAQQIERD